MRETLKTFAFWLAVVAMLPAWLSFQVRRRLLGGDRALHGSSQALSLLPGLSGQYLRRAFLWLTLDACATSATVEFGTVLSQRHARIDENVYVGPHCHLGLVHLGRDVLLAAGVHVPSGGATHGTARTDRPIREQDGTAAMIHIGEGTWIGSAAVVLADVGRHSVIGAGAVVTHPLPDFVVAAGVPARVIRSRRAAEEYQGVAV